MSQALTETDEETGAPAETDVETRARAMGWKPRDEYRGPAGAWRTAEVFVSKGENDLPILRESNRRMEQQIAAIKRGQEQAASVVLDMGERLRTADERAYKRAKERLEAEREQAVEAGDKKAWRTAEAELEQLKADAPKPAPTRPAPVVDVPPAPEAVAWADSEPWFKTDPVLCGAAQDAHTRLLNSHPELTLAQNLARVSRTVRAMYPEKFAHEAPAVPPEPAEPEENPRRSEASPVGSSSPTRPLSPKSVEARWKALPQEGRDAFDRYKAVIAAKPGAKPLTKEEWLESVGE